MGTHVMHKILALAGSISAPIRLDQNPYRNRGVFRRSWLRLRLYYSSQD